ncbi:prolyl oligopeptidase family serine peptidase [Rhizobium sp. SSA_523]|uniref:prolyl oligopeptidase family serine peptidase n=1 Tax=Rhizobium sp. SSA_523 TaxID=2952477 RepID=UPI0020919B1F|nr:prolyl oligopeptidase family serine peptidase [Rhizobium sp. SSA_523]MCO5730754.1 prolyl oligopeptidase family serine peptidase [Rhizobium sp. SSA_523]WKC24422.1 prolyl oligopeptidase family serine peptidase [Rhizobium sp. SSA_523]
MDLFLEKDDDPQTLAFVAARNAEAQKALASAAMDADAAAIQAMMERQDRLIIPARRGKWLFDFNRSVEHPLGVLRRLPADQQPRADGAWETVFDVDQFCKEDGRRWIFSGCVTCPFEPTRVLLRLSDGGSDLTRFLEFDLEAKARVEQGFDTPAVRAHAAWLNPDEIAYFGSIDSASATQSGWPRVGRRLRRGEDPANAEILFEAAPTDVTGYGFIIDPKLGGYQHADPRQLRVFVAVHAIGQMSVYVETGVGKARRLPLPTTIGFDLNHSHCLWLAKDDEEVPGGSLVLQALTPMAEEALAPARRILVAQEPGRAVNHFALMRNWAVYTVNDRLAPSLYVLDLTREDAQPQRIDLPAGVEAISFSPLHADLHLGDDTLTVIGYGFLVPPTRYRLALSNDEGLPVRTVPKLVPEETSPAYFDAEGMTSELLEATSEDGTKVPYHLVVPKHWTKGELPVLIYGYGGFSASLGPQYSGTTGRLLEQGCAYVQAYIRGGSELGPQWHTPVKRHGRHKAYEDFVAIARDLVKRGYSRPSRIACTGASNGGLLTGVMLTRYPEDFGAVWCRVPVADMLRFHLFPAGKAWMDEYGDPEHAADRDYLLTYSPLHNVAPAADRAYPPHYIESSSNDDRVHPSHARRLAKALEDAGHRPLFHEHGSGGHGGAGSSAEMARRTAMGYSFLRKTILKPD